MDFCAMNERILPPDEGAAWRARARLNEIAKPVGSLGALEDDLVAVAALTGSERISLKPRAVLAMCADNGVAAPDIAITPVRVTRTVAEMMARGESNVCRMARLAGAEVFPYDVGMFTRSDEAGPGGPHISDGTKNILSGPAMTAEQAEAALTFGMERAEEFARRGYRLLATGERRGQHDHVGGDGGGASGAFAAGGNRAWLRTERRKPAAEDCRGRTGDPREPAERERCV